MQDIAVIEDPAAAKELAWTVTTLVSKYHAESTEHGRDHRIAVAVHPSMREAR
jgi:hypothetical protein